jgi:hypothetical protein
MNAKFPKRQILLILLLILLMLPVQPKSVHAQSGCDPATGQQCDQTPAPTCGQPGQPPCGGGSGGGSNSDNKPKATKTSPLPVITRTFTPTATEIPSPTATRTLTPSHTPTSDAQSATLSPRPTEPAITQTEVGVNPFARQQATSIPYAWQIFPIDFGGSGQGSSLGNFLLFGILGVLIIIGILWFRSRYFADGSVRGTPMTDVQLLHDDNSFGDSLRGNGTQDKTR